MSAIAITTAQYATKIHRNTLSSAPKLGAGLRSAVTNMQNATMPFANASRGGTNHGEESKLSNQSDSPLMSHMLSSPPEGSNRLVAAIKAA